MEFGVFTENEALTVACFILLDICLRGHSDGGTLRHWLQDRECYIEIHAFTLTRLTPGFMSMETTVNECAASQSV